MIRSTKRAIFLLFFSRWSAANDTRFRISTVFKEICPKDEKYIGGFTSPFTLALQLFDGLSRVPGVRATVYVEVRYLGRLFESDDSAK